MRIPESLAGVGFLVGPAAVITSGALAPHHPEWLVLTLPLGIAGMFLWLYWAATK